MSSKRADYTEFSIILIATTHTRLPIRSNKLQSLQLVAHSEKSHRSQTTLKGNFISARITRYLLFVQHRWRRSFLKRIILHATSTTTQITIFLRKQLFSILKKKTLLFLTNFACVELRAVVLWINHKLHGVMLLEGLSRIEVRQKT